MGSTTLVVYLSLVPDNKSSKMLCRLLYIQAEVCYRFTLVFHISHEI